MLAKETDGQMNHPITHSDLVPMLLLVSRNNRDLESDPILSSCQEDSLRIQPVSKKYLGCLASVLNTKPKMIGPKGNKIHCFLRDQSSSVSLKYTSQHRKKNREDSAFLTPAGTQICRGFEKTI